MISISPPFGQVMSAPSVHQAGQVEQPQGIAITSKTMREPIATGSFEVSRIEFLFTPDGRSVVLSARIIADVDVAEIKPAELAVD